MDRCSDRAAQNLTDAWVAKAAGPLVENRIADGLSVGYIEGDHFGIVHLGSSNQTKEKANYSTVYELGSISKVFTSLLLADAVVRGEIDLNAAADATNPAGIRLPSRDGRSIQWIDLSTHRSGLPRLPSNLPLTDLTNPYRDYDSKQAAAFLNQYELPRQPGKSQEYSNFGASVLGYLVAAKAGKTYEQLLRERIAEPLRMTDCTVTLTSDQTKRLATPHDKFGSATPPWTFSDLPGAGGVHATMRDMMRFAKAQLNPPAGKLGDAIELAWKQQRDADASGSAMGLGWMIAGDGQTRWHNGQTGGSHAALFINREQKCAVVVLCNTAVTNEIDQLATQLIQKAAGQNVDDPDHGRRLLPPVRRRRRPLADAETADDARLNVWAQQPKKFFDRATIDSTARWCSPPASAKKGWTSLTRALGATIRLLVTLAETGEVLRDGESLRAIGPATKERPRRPTGRSPCAVARASARSCCAVTRTSASRSSSTAGTPRT